MGALPPNPRLRALIVSGIGMAQPVPRSIREHAPLAEQAPAPVSLRYLVPRDPARHPLVIPLAVLYAAVIFVWCALRHRHFGSSAFELGAYHSVLWNVAYRGTPWNSLERVVLKTERALLQEVLEWHSITSFSESH